MIAVPRHVPQCAQRMWHAEHRSGSTQKQPPGHGSAALHPQIAQTLILAP